MKKMNSGKKPPPRCPFSTCGMQEEKHRGVGRRSLSILTTNLGQ